MELPNWSPSPPEWPDKIFALLNKGDITKPASQKLQSIIESSKKFPIPFPIQTGRCETLKQYVSESILERNINSAYPVIHENALEFYCKFIDFKLEHGSRIEKQFYKNMSLKDFVERLLKKRAVMFMGPQDKYVLLNGASGSKNWETIGTDKEKPPLVLEDCLSYDEVKCAVFLSVSSYTYFVNIGDRKNMAKFTENRAGIEDEGVIVGMIGARMKKPNVMEYQEIVATEKQNNEKNGYGSAVKNSVHQLFSKFYEEKCLNYNETIANMTASEGRYTNLQAKGIFDNFYYYKRLTITIDTLLLEANYRAKEKNTTAYVHVVGLGLGVWVISPHQEKVYMEIFAKRLELLGAKLGNISDLCFAYINQPTCGQTRNGEMFPINGHPLSGIRIEINKRQPHAKLRDAHRGKLLVVSYAWDGNAFPGNEYWSGKLGSSGDSAAASSTQITELHNPCINPKVCADNLMVITGDQMMSLDKYREKIRCLKAKRPLGESS